MVVAILLVVIVIFVIWYRQRNPVAQTTVMLPVSAALQAPLMAQSSDLSTVVAQTTDAPQSTNGWVSVASTPMSTGGQATDSSLGTYYEPADDHTVNVVDAPVYM